ncbi:outer membrane beta-barrel protein [Nibribacter ruber]|uniref:Outer membrane beta-barrel protein n=1 Tax=Nibribacter ruber TaxID=2698458 RepID=A0A6P1NVZ4_9BACT|nr:outer membrane beta-barrel protein [Nibribacter ruber]QHL86494.1 outer membrane beta-barrel protein [Nibribacter ruber]
MKKYLFFFLLALCTQTSFGQNLASTEEEPYYFDEYDGWYVKLGLNVAGVRGLGGQQNEVERIKGFAAGLGYTRQLSSRDNLWLSVEAQVAQQGFKFKFAHLASDPEYLRVTYFNLPVLVRYFPLQEHQYFYVGAGPQVGFRMTGQIQQRAGGTLEVQDEAFSNVDISGVLAVGAHIKHLPSAGAEVRYQYGFSKFVNPIPEARHSVFQVNVFFPAQVISNLFGGALFPPLRLR